MTEPKFVAIEGIDASGKATQSRMLAARLGAALLSFPDYKTKVGQAIDGNLKNEWSACVPGVTLCDEPTNALVIQALMTINRYEAASEIVRLLAAGDRVVLDRYYASGIVYGTADGLDTGWLERIHAFLPEPDAWVFLDVDPAESGSRRPEHRDRYERKRGFQAKCREIYFEIFRARQRQGRPWYIVDGHGDRDLVHSRICAAIGID
jgi:dTMP kinase